MEKYPNIEEILSFSWFVRSKPFMVKPAKRRTGLCGSCLQAHLLAEDYIKANAFRPMTQEEKAEWRRAHGEAGADEDDDQDEEEEGEEEDDWLKPYLGRPKDDPPKGKVLLHHNCQCPCQWCQTKGCQQDHPYQPGITDHQFLYRLIDNVLCPPAERTFDCYSAQCDKCGEGKKGMWACPLEANGEGQCQWHVVTYEEEPVAVVGGGGGGGTRAADGGDDEDGDPTRKSRRVQKKRKKTGARPQYFAFMMMLLSAWFLHDYTRSMQKAEFKRLLENLPPGHLVIQVGIG